jgi:3-oxoacyl-[acyl-carrier-protein] synthase II
MQYTSNAAVVREMVTEACRSPLDDGHTLGAAGGVEAVICALVCRDGKIPPTINYETPDPECGLNYGTQGMTERPVRLSLSNSFGFGGHNVCLAIKRYEA